MNIRRRTVKGERIYRALVRLYPADFRAEFGEMMVDFYRDRAAGASPFMRIRLYSHVVRGALLERAAPLRPRSPAPASDIIPYGGTTMTWSDIRQDIAYAMRSLSRTPSFLVTVLLTLTAGIGANIAVFSVVSGVLLRPLPFGDPARLIQLSGNEAPSTLSEPELRDVATSAHSFVSIGAYSYANGNMTGDGTAELVRIARVTGDFFATLAPALQGRGIVPDDDRPGGADVVVISYGLAQQRFGSVRSAVGNRILIDGAPQVVVGVTPPNFDFPAANVDVWRPLRLDRQAMVTRNNHYLRLVARLAPNVSLRAADDEMRRMRDAWARDYPTMYIKNEPMQVDVKPLRDRVVGAAEPYLVALLGAVGFVLLIGCVNVASLVVARTESRRRDMAIRAALGATSRRIAMQLALESGIVTLAGGLLGVLAAGPLVRLLVSVAPAAIPRLGEVRIDSSALAFAAAATVFTGIVFAIAPLFGPIGKRDLTELTGSARSTSQTGSRAARRVRGALVITQVALAVVMLGGSVLFTRTLIALDSTPLGFATDGTILAQVTLPRRQYDSARTVAFVADLVARLRAMPSVAHAAAMAWTPIVAGGGSWWVEAESAPVANPAAAPLAEPQQVTPGFFAALSIPVLRGRDFDAGDRVGADGVIIVNEALARKLWSTTDVLGRRLRLPGGRNPWMRVVGVVADTRVDGLTEPAPPVMYFPHAQAAVTGFFVSSAMTLVILSSRSTDLPAHIRAAVREMDPNVPVSDVRTMQGVVASTIAQHRFTTVMLTGLAVLAMALAAIGIYGVIAYTVAQRRYELGLRMALGARADSVLALVVRGGLALAGIGLAIGIAGIIGLSRALRSVLTGLGSVDANLLIVVSSMVFVVALVALAVPARRALLIDPVEALRGE